MAVDEQDTTGKYGLSESSELNIAADSVTVITFGSFGFQDADTKIDKIR